MSDPIWIRITDTTLSDGSIAYGLQLGSIELDCVDERSAERIADYIEAHTVGTQYCGWTRVQRRA